MKKKKVLAVQLPAPCPLSCEFCRTPAHSDGNPDKVINAIFQNYDACDEIYLTSNGETGMFVGYKELVQMLLGKNKKVSVLCATPRSIVPGIIRAEISLNEYTKRSAEQAIEKAKSLNIPFTISLVAGEHAPNLELIGKEYGAEAVLLRARQKEGLSTSTYGETALLKLSSNNIGVFPVASYKELNMFDDYSVTCINHFGDMVSYLGQPQA